MNFEKYLPIGTIVLLRGGQKRIMITGFCCVSNDDQTKTFDYSGCLYPEGFISSDKTLLFDHSQIEKIYYLGYSDEEEKQFKTNLKEMLKNISDQQ